MIKQLLRVLLYSIFGLGLGYALGIIQTAQFGPPNLDRLAPYLPKENTINHMPELSKKLEV